MDTRKYDRELGIKTAGLREWDGHRHYNRYEATPYEALKALFKSYQINKHSGVVDFGCGRGRVAFYIHNRFRVPVIGIEANDKTYREALDNKDRYLRKAKHIKTPIVFEYGLAEQYEIKPQDTCFYFFNPFSSKVFAKVLRNIMASLEQAPRSIDLILYYPLQTYKEVVKQYPFKQIHKVRSPKVQDPLEKFIVYRLPTTTDQDGNDYLAQASWS
ncbi:MAG: SAM-dependent methyltransferase [Limnochordia bacterium]